jgi:two-component system sensor histidine kinase DesK
VSPTAPATLDPGQSPRARAGRRLAIFSIIAYFILVPAVSRVSTGVTPSSLFLLVGSVAFIALITWAVIVRAPPGSQQVPWVWLTVIVALAIALFAVDGHRGDWVNALAVAAASCGRFTKTIRPVAFGAISCTAAGLIVATLDHYSEGNMTVVLILPAMAGFFAYTAGQRNETVATLRDTRAELARVAVAEERLRIARDLHDLLGHSLSLITLKAELSRRIIGTDTERAGREIAELEAVARQSLRDVREAVAGYRQPDLSAELGAARHLLTAAGIACQITAPAIRSLSGDVDAVLAWTIREGITNVVRHARATSVVISVTSDRDAAVAEIADDGVGAPPAVGLVDGGAPGATLARLRPTGSGLAGLAERVRALGGDLSAGQVRPCGFRLRVTIPISGRES